MKLLLIALCALLGGCVSMEKDEWGTASVVKRISVDEARLRAAEVGRAVRNVVVPTTVPEGGYGPNPDWDWVLGTSKRFLVDMGGNKGAIRQDDLDCYRLVSGQPLGGPGGWNKAYSVDTRLPDDDLIISYYALAWSDQQLWAVITPACDIPAADPAIREQQETACAFHVERMPSARYCRRKESHFNASPLWVPAAD